MRSCRWAGFGDFEPFGAFEKCMGKLYPFRNLLHGDSRLLQTSSPIATPEISQSSDTLGRKKLVVFLRQNQVFFMGFFCETRLFKNKWVRFSMSSG